MYCLQFCPLYREPIFKLIDAKWECDWYFGHNTTDIKSISPDTLKRMTYVNNRHLAGIMGWQDGIGRLIRDKRYDRYLMLGEPMVLSTWWNLIQRRLFYPQKRIYLWSHGWYGREGLLKNGLNGCSLDLPTMYSHMGSMQSRLPSVRDST